LKQALTLALALVLTLAAGCSPASAPPAAPEAPAAEAPPVTEPAAEEPPATASEPAAEGSLSPADAGEILCPASVDVGVWVVGTYKFDAVTDGLCTAVAPAEAFDLVLAFPSGVSEDAMRSAVAVASGEVVRYRFSAGGMIVRLAAAQPGTVTTVRVRGPVGVGGSTVNLGFGLRREPAPTVAIEVQVGDGPWKPHEPGEFLPPGPARVRLAFGRPVGAPQVEGRIESQLMVPAGSEPQMTWTDSRTLLLSFAKLPPVLFVDFSAVEDDRGLQFRDQVLYLRSDTPPRLAALDPASGREEDLGPAPLDILWSTASPDGRWVLLEATRPTSRDDVDVWLIDTATVRARKTDLDESPYGPGYIWFADRLVVAGWDELQEWDLTRHERRLLSEASYAGPLSPDGRYLAGRVLHLNRTDPNTWLAPLTVAVYDLATNTERLFPEVGNFRNPHRGGDIPIHVPMRWGDDGRSLYVLQYAEDSTPDNPRTYWAVLDLDTGVLTPADNVPDEPLREPQPVTSPSGWAFRPAQWGGRGEVNLVSPQGLEVAYGEGRPLAWLPDDRLLLVRWADGYPRIPGW